VRLTRVKLAKYKWYYVHAKGEVRIINGNMKYIDNSSGHCLRRVDSAQKAAEYAFNQSGLNTADKYIEKLWVEDFRFLRRGSCRTQQ